MEKPSESVWSAVGARAVTIGALATSAVVHAALVFQHADEALYAGAFGAAAVGAAAVAYGLTRPGLSVAPAAAVALLGSLLVAYPVVTATTGDEVDALGLATKTVEAVGLLAALRARGDRDASLAPVAVIAGFLLAFLLLSVAGGTHGH